MGQMKMSSQAQQRLFREGEISLQLNHPSSGRWRIVESSGEHAQQQGGEWSFDEVSDSMFVTSLHASYNDIHKSQLF